MLVDINQRSDKLYNVIQRYGCLFLCFAYSSPDVFEGDGGIIKLNSYWAKCRKERIIDSVDNIVDHNAMARLFSLNARYDDIHHDADEKIPEKVKYIFGEYFWLSSHFVVLDKEKRVVFDPLINSSTVKNGALKSMRWYYD